MRAARPLYCNLTYRATAAGAARYFIFSSNGGGRDGPRARVGKRLTGKRPKRGADFRRRARCAFVINIVMDPAHKCIGIL